MVTLLDIKRTYSDGGMRLLLLADSKEDTLPTLLSDIDGLSGAGGGYSGQYSNYSCIRCMHYGQ